MNVKPIFNGFVAKQLLQMGNKIVDLQKNKNVPNATIFYFEYTEKLIKDLETVTAK